MNKRYEMRFTGSGGQGVILASVILAEAAVLSDINVVQSQAYGPEARGGMSRAEAVFSRDPIWFSKVVCPDFLLALTQVSLDKYAQNIAKGAVVMIDGSLTPPQYLDPKQVVALPILRTAKETVGNSVTANIVAVGAINGVLGLFSGNALQEAVKRHIPKGTEALNRAALEAGKQLASAFHGAQFHQSIA